MSPITGLSASVGYRGQLTQSIRNTPLQTRSAEEQGETGPQQATENESTESDGQVGTRIDVRA
jgi:hypothetical protein